MSGEIKHVPHLRLAALDHQVTQQSLLIGFQNAFLVMVLVPVIGIVLTLLIGKHKTP